MTAITTIWEGPAILGEGPIWDAVAGALWFTDIKAPRIHRFDPVTARVKSWDAPESVGWVIPARGGALVAGLKSGLFRFDPADGRFERLVEVEPERPDNRLNDATVDRNGHIWFGTMDDREEEATGRFYRWDGRDLTALALDPVAVFGASNFPFAFSTAGGDTASALAAGCPVVIKGHPAHPGTDSMVADAMRKAAERTGMPEGTVGHVRGPGKELGEALVKDPRIAAVGFTGSRGGGLALAQIAQQRDVPIPVFAEMSSVNPVVLMPEALKTQGAELGQAFAGSLTMGAGQFCTNPGLIFAIKGEGLDAFEQAAAKALSDHEPQTMLTTGIRDAYAAGVAKLAEDGAVETLATGVEGDGKTREAARLFAAEASHIADHPELLEEMFGAASIIVRCDSLEQMAAILETVEGQLTATLHLAGGDAAQARPLMPILERKAGRILVNGWPTGVEVAHAMVHGGPFPATTDGRTTSVGTLAIERFLRPVSYQNMPAELLPPELADYEQLPHMLDGTPA